MTIYVNKAVMVGGSLNLTPNKCIYALNTFAYVCEFVRACVRVCVCACVHARVRVCPFDMRTCGYACAWIDWCVRACVCACILIQYNNTIFCITILGPTIVHEWGHLRWGLRDEYPVNGTDRFYHSDGAVSAVKCGKYMKGSHVDYVTRGECELNRTTGLPTHTCYFKPLHSDPGVKASLMFYHNVTEVTCLADTVY